MFSQLTRRAPAGRSSGRAMRSKYSSSIPYAMVAAAVICAETDERARFLAGSGALSFLRLRAGRPGPMPSPQEAADYPYNELERAFIEDRLATQMVHDPADRLASFERVAALAAAPGVSARG